MLGYLIRQTLLRLPPLLRLAFEKGGLNKTIEPIFVEFIESILNLAVLCEDFNGDIVRRSTVLCPNTATLDMRTDRIH